MKNLLRLHIMILVMCFFYGCKENSLKQGNEKNEPQSEIKKQKKILQDSTKVTVKKNIAQPQIIQFVSAKSGLNFRDKPNGRILGKFSLNRQLKVIDSTKIFEQVDDDGKILKGEWLGIEKDNDTVYVFSSFLSDFYNYSDIKLFYASPYNKSFNEIKQGFVNLSELFPFEYENESITIIPEDKFGQEPIQFNKNQSNEILKRIGISKKDSLYIFSFSKDSIYKFPVSELKMIAYLNAYSHKEIITDEYPYEIGFNLEDKFSDQGDNFAYVGIENPFQTGKIKPLIWNETDNDNFPLLKLDIENQNKSDNISYETYTLSLLHFKYFIQSHIYHNNNRSRVRTHQLIVIDTTKNKITTELKYSSSESISISPVYKSSDEKMENYYSWTGELFKNKPPIIYGMYGNSFGCSTVDFITENEPSIRIYCDNRH